MEREFLTGSIIKPDTGIVLQQNRTALTSRSQTVNVGQQLGLGNAGVSHQADVYVALREESQNRKSVESFYKISWRRMFCLRYAAHISSVIIP